MIFFKEFLMSSNVTGFAGVSGSEPDGTAVNQKGFFPEAHWNHMCGHSSIFSLVLLFLL